MSKSKTLGEKRIRTDFNVSGDSKVLQIKMGAAALLDLINDTPEPEGLSKEYLGEFKRLKAKALTNLETAAMYAVKMATV